MMNNPTDEYQARLTAVRQHLSAWGVAALLVTSPANRRWLSGFTGSAGALLISADQAILATDSRYWEQAQQQAPAFTLFRHQRTAVAEQSFLAAAGVDSIGLEAHHVTLSEAARRRTAAPNISWHELDAPVEPLRTTKSAAELRAIRAAAAITDQVMAQVPHLARPGLTEAALAWELEKRLRAAGAEATAFDVLVAAGPHAARPHHQPGSRPLQAGDTLIVDMGAQVAGYKSDLTRTFYLGEPDAQFQTIFDLVGAAQTAVFNHTRPGQNGNEVDALARDVIVAGGHGDHFGHGLGHGVGLEIHEPPFFNRNPDSQAYTVTPGMVITVEPGIYLPGWGGVRREDLCLVTADGLELLSQCPHAPAIAL